MGGRKSQNFDLGPSCHFIKKKKSVLYKKGVIFGQIVSEKGVFFRLGNADTSYLVHMSAGTGV